MNNSPRFSLGKIVGTPGALAALEKANQSSVEFIQRHVSGDWGECCDDDRQANEDALQDGARIFSVYKTALGKKLYVVTEADRSSTCLLLPDEY